MKSTLRIQLGLLSLVAAMAVPLAAKAGESADVIAVKFHADYCATCVALDDIIPGLKKEFTKDVLFVQLDFTDEVTTSQSKLLADRLGVSSIIPEEPGTGFILLLDEEGKEIGKLTKTQSADEMAAAIRTATSAS